MPSRRRYQDGCAAAHALDLIGERWALLVVRDLLLGPRRFTDLRGALPGISPNVLSQRLGDLEDSGVVRRRQLPPPAASWVYELTDWGQELEPVLQGLGRWGARSPDLPRGSAISLATLITAMKTMFYPPAAQDLNATLALRLGQEDFGVRVENSRLSVTPGAPARPDAAIRGDVQTLGALIFGGQSLAEAEARGTVVVGGDRPVAERFLRIFRLPEPVGVP
jgi:DNA-binding HxlR family transcriptional regulator